MNSNVKRLSELQKEQIELKLFNVFQELDITSLVADLERLKTFRKDLEEIQAVLETAKCCLEKICNKKSFFCC